MPLKNQKLAAALDQATEPTYCSAQDVRAQMTPILRVAALVQKQAAHERELLAEAEGDPDHDVLLDPSIEALHLSIDSLETDAKELFRIGRRLGTTKAQLERYWGQVRAEIECHDDAEAAKAAKAAATEASTTGAPAGPALS